MRQLSSQWVQTHPPAITYSLCPPPPPMIGSGRLDANIADAIKVWGSDLCSGRMYNLDLTWVGVALTLILTYFGFRERVSCFL